MHSSISASERCAARSPIVALLLFALGVGLGVEGLSVYSLKRFGETERRLERQYPAAMALRSGDARPPSVLILGNSLMEEGVDVVRLQRALAASLHVEALFLEATAYFDWYYGLRRLFREGARPTVVVLGLAPGHFLESGVRPDYFARALMDRRDLFRVAADVGMDRTATTNLFFASISDFWGHRGVVRTKFLSLLLPDVERLMFSLSRRKAQRVSDLEFVAVAAVRLRAMGALCEAHGAALIALVPPTHVLDDGSRLLKEAGVRARVQVLVPIAPGVLSRQWFRDEAHLNAEGSSFFTDAFAKDLKQAVSLATGRRDQSESPSESAGALRELESLN
jgi:hypothetical protein